MTVLMVDANRLLPQIVQTALGESLEELLSLWFTFLTPDVSNEKSVVSGSHCNVRGIGCIPISTEISCYSNMWQLYLKRPTT